MCPLTSVWAQLSTNEKPISFGIKSGMTVKRRSAKAVAKMPSIDIAKIEAEDLKDKENFLPPRFGYKHKVNYNLDNSGTWYTLSNGDMLWKLNIVCPEAISVNFCYDKFWIPEGGKFFIYSKDEKQYIGAYTSRNNRGNRESPRGFATELIKSNDVVLEYYQPKNVTSDAIISIDYVVHGYKDLIMDTKSYYNDPDNNCMVNVNCDEGRKWQEEKRAVALMVVEGYRYGTGSLITTTDSDHKPYFLTADHCLGGWANWVKHDAVSYPELDYYTFYWNYETPGCYMENIEPIPYTTSGARVLANNSVSDFALLELSEDPIELPNYTPFYLGWDNSGSPGEPGVCIHHPCCDVKKISSVRYTPGSSSWDYTPNTHWEVYWKETWNGFGTTNPGSSGSALLTKDHKVIGQLHGGWSSCSQSGKNEPDYYGKFSVSWNGYGNDSIQRKLSCWLDSLNIGCQTMNGLTTLSRADSISDYVQLKNDYVITKNGELTLDGYFGELELIGDVRLIVEKGGKLIIDGGKLLNAELVLKPGATLQIKNEGVIETRHGFKAQKGAIVDIQYGWIY